MTKSSHLPFYVALALPFLAGCMSTPVQDFQDYARAFAEAQTQGDVFLDDAASAMAFAARRSDGEPAPQNGQASYPDVFEPQQEFAGVLPSEPVAVAARRDALAVVRQYNDVLVRLAEGRDGEELAGSVNALADRVTGFARLLGASANPLAGVGVSALSKALEFAAQRRGEAEFRRAILGGYDDVDAILEALIEDTSTLYEIHLIRQEFELTEIKASVNAPFRAIDGLGRKFAAPRQGSVLAQSRAVLEDRYAAAITRMRGPGEYAIPAGKRGRAPAYDQTVQDALWPLVRDIEASAIRHDAVVARINAYFAAMKIYNGLLHEARASLATVRDAVETEPDPATVAANLRRSAETLVMTARALRDQLNIARAGL